MVFDGDSNSGAPELIYPAAYHSRARCAASAPSRALRIAYTYARHFGQEVWTSHVAVNHMRPDIQRTFDLILSTTWVRIGAGWHYLPLSTTHLSGFAMFSVAENIVGQTIQVRAQIKDKNGNVDTGASVSVQAPSGDVGSALGLRQTTPYVPETGGIGPFAEGLATNVLVPVDVQIVNAVRGDWTSSWIEGFATSSGIARPIIPHFSCMFWEVRG